jgi:hypothetical protein
MTAFFEAILNFFRGLFGGGGSDGQASGGGVTGGQTAPTDQASIAYFFYKVATSQSVYTAFSGSPIPTVQNDPDLSLGNKQTLVAALNLGGYPGYQNVYNALVSEANAGNAVVWICIWIVGARRP